MRNPRRLFMLLLATLILLPGLSEAQRSASKSAATKDPFLGVWKLSAEKSKYESGGAPKSFTRTYEERGDGTFFMTTDVGVSGGNVRAYLVYRRDGQPYPEAAQGAESIRLVAIKAVDPRTEEMYLVVDGKLSDRPTTISISSDGLTMTQVVNGKTSKGQPFTNTVVFDRQS